MQKRLSEGEELFAFHLTAQKLTMEREYAFMSAEGRKFRFDFADCARKIAVEVEGGTWSNGRHNRGKGFEDDCRKYAEAAVRGWMVFRFTTRMVQTGEAIAFVKTALGVK